VQPPGGLYFLDTNIAKFSVMFVSFVDSVGALAIRPTGNVQGGYYFYNLNKGKIINKNHWIELPMPLEVVTQADKLAKSSGLT